MQTSAPTSTMVYWADYHTSNCASSSCVSVTVNVISYLPYQPDTIEGNTHPFTGNYEIYRTTNTTGIEYLWTLPSNWSGYSNTNSISVLIGQGFRSNSGNTFKCLWKWIA